MISARLGIDWFSKITLVRLHLIQQFAPPTLAIKQFCTSFHVPLPRLTRRNVNQHTPYYRYSYLPFELRKSTFRMCNARRTAIRQSLATERCISLARKAVVDTGYEIPDSHTISGHWRGACILFPITRNTYLLFGHMDNRYQILGKRLNLLVLKIACLGDNKPIVTWKGSILYGVFPFSQKLFEPTPTAIALGNLYACEFGSIGLLSTAHHSNDWGVVEQVFKTQITPLYGIAALTIPG